MHACSVAKLCPTLCDPMDCSPLGFFVHRTYQARMTRMTSRQVDYHLLLQGYFKKSCFLKSIRCEAQRDDRNGIT